MSIVALERHLLPLRPFLEKDGVTEICINQPGGVFVESDGAFQYGQVPELSYPFLESLAALVAEFNHKPFPAVMVSGSLLNKERAQFVLPPACEKGKIICSIRRQQTKNLSLADYEAKGSFLSLQKQGDDKSKNKTLIELYRKRDYRAFVELAIKAKKNILICGGTGTGKTTFLNACLKEIPTHERLITVEDTREVVTAQPNSANLLFNEEHEASSSLNIFKACLRLRPDRIFLSELRGAEVWPYLRAANSGHPGSLSTVHADSPEGAFMQLVFMMQQAGSTSTEEQLKRYIQSIIHIFVQLAPDESCFVRVEEVWFGD